MKSAWIVGVALAAGVALQGEVPDEEPDVTVYVESDGPFPGIAVMAEAKKMAAAMFAGIGVRLAWAAVGKGGVETGGIALHLRIAERPKANFADAVVAYADPRPDGTKAIVILWDRLQAQCQGPPRLLPVLMAHIVAHEIAHVLEGVARHSSTGVMKARWTWEDYRKMLWKPLPFTPYDATLIRRGRGAGPLARAAPPGPAAR